VNTPSIARIDIIFMTYLPLARPLLLLFLVFLSQATHGRFSGPRQLSLAAPSVAIAAGDLNRDGFVDLVVGGLPLEFQSAKVRVLLGRGNGNFTQAGEYRVGYHPFAENAFWIAGIKIGDLDNDGKPDVVVAHSFNGTQFNNSPLLATVLMGNGDGTLQERESQIFPTANGDAPFGLDLADFDGDGLLDAAISCYSGTRGTVFGLRSLGGGNFQTLGPRTVSDPIESIRAVDVNRDSRPDVIVTTFRGTIVLYGNGTFVGGPGFGAQLGAEGNVSGLVVDNFDGMGAPEIIVSDTFAPTIRVFQSRGFNFQYYPTVYSIPSPTRSLNSADINGDGKRDLIVGIEGTRDLYVMYGNGRGGFHGSEVIDLDLPGSGIAYADFDGNGKIDMGMSIYAEPPEKQVAIYLNAPNTARYYTDFDGDVASDFTVFRPGQGMWYIRNSASTLFWSQQFGLASDRIVPGNYNNDNKADIAVYRDGTWYILESGGYSFRTETFGTPEDIPVPADYDNDGIMNLAVFRPLQGKWFVRTVDGYYSVDWGIAGDKPVPADYDGDGKTDIAVWRSSTATWYIRQSSDDSIRTVPFGDEQFGDVPVPSDYDGDGKADIAIWRPSDGSWHIVLSTDQYIVWHWGVNGDIPVPADYDRDGNSDLAVWRPTEGRWYIVRSSNGSIGSINWGIANDVPVRGF
jgi:hypothetical protein